MIRTLALGAALLAAAAGSAVAAGDAVAGAATFKKCAACHSVGPDARNKIGPILNDVVGRVAGTEAGFSYSQAMVNAGVGGLVWTPETLGPWLHKPKDVVPGTKMTFAGLAEQADIDNVIAYLLTLSPSYVPPAEPSPAAPDVSSSSAAQ